MTSARAHAGDLARALPIALAVALAAWGILVTILYPTAPAVADVATDLTSVPAEVADAIGAYGGPRALAALAARLLTLAVAIALLAVPAARHALARVAGERSSLGRECARAAAVAALVALALALVVLPVAVWAGLVQDGAWGFRVGSAALWWRDRLVRLGLDVGTAALAGAVLWLLVRRTGRRWPWHATWAATVLAALLAIAWPLIAATLLLPTQDLPAGPTRDAIVALAARAGHPDARIVVAEASTRSTRTNAQVVGLGPTEQIVLHDTLLDRPLPEIVGVVSHELAHAEHRDLERGVLATAAALLPLGLGLRWLLGRRAVQRLVRADGDDHPRMVVVIIAVLALAQVVAEPAVLWQSRRVERSADHAALVLTEDPSALIAIERSFVIRDLAAVDPPAWRRWLSTHPSVGERIRAAVQLARLSGLDLASLEELSAAEREAGVPWHRPA